MASNKISAGTASKLTRKMDRSKAEKIQSALYQIADAASAVTDMQEFYAACIKAAHLHTIWLAPWNRNCANISAAQTSLTILPYWP